MRPNPDYQQAVERLAYFERIIDGYDQRCLTLGDLESLCRKRRIYLLYRPMHFLHGIALARGEKRMIGINSRLTYSEKVIAGFHELYHHVFHLPYHPQQAKDMSPADLPMAVRQQYEFEANSAGAIALMPTAVVRGLGVSAIQRTFDVSPQNARFRRSLLRHLATAAHKEGIYANGE